MQCYGAIRLVGSVEILQHTVLPATDTVKADMLLYCPIDP